MTVVDPPFVVSITANLAEQASANPRGRSPLEAFTNLWAAQFLDPVETIMWVRWLRLERPACSAGVYQALLRVLCQSEPRDSMKLRALFGLLTFNPSHCPLVPCGTQFPYFDAMETSTVLAPQIPSSLHLPACGLVVAFARLLAEQHKATRPGDYPWRISEAYNRELLWWLKHGLGSAPVRDPHREQVLEAYQIHVPGSNQPFLREVFDDPNLREEFKVALDLRARTWVCHTEPNDDRISIYIQAVAEGWKTKGYAPYSRELLLDQATFALQRLRELPRPPRVFRVYTLVRALRGKDEGVQNLRRNLIRTLRTPASFGTPLMVYPGEWGQVRALIRLVGQDSALAGYLQDALKRSREEHGPNLKAADEERRREANELAAAWKALC